MPTSDLREAQVSRIMSSKKKDKIVKDGQSDPLVVDEPPQPSSDAPFCLTLVIDVCLEAAKLPSTNVNEEASKKPEGNMEISMVEEHLPHLVDPVFRYAFVNGEKIITPPVGKPGSSWTPLTNTSSSAYGDLEMSAQLADEQAHSAEAGGAHAPDHNNCEPIVWRYKRVHKLEGTNDEEACIRGR